ncbi:MAG: hypothetical protein SW833_18020 [Cyanobacteriota bacterium]|nr:hypothetical protein [Cyanobacteriota bacterium]
MGNWYLAVVAASVTRGLPSEAMSDNGTATPRQEVFWTVWSYKKIGAQVFPDRDRALDLMIVQNLIE